MLVFCRNMTPTESSLICLIVGRWLLDVPPTLDEHGMQQIRDQEIALRHGPFAEFLREIPRSAEATCLLHDLHLVNDQALYTALAALNSPGRVARGLCNAMRWIGSARYVQAITWVNGVWTPKGLLMTVVFTLASPNKPRKWWSMSLGPRSKGHAARVRVVGPPSFTSTLISR